MLSSAIIYIVCAIGYQLAPSLADTVQIQSGGLCLCKDMDAQCLYHCFLFIKALQQVKGSAPPGSHFLLHLAVFQKSYSSLDHSLLHRTT